MKSKILRATEFRWSDIPVRPYENGGEQYRDVTRQTLFGAASGEDALAFETRYFEIAAGGFSSFEHHEHPHVVVVLRGRGSVRLGGGPAAIAPFDAVYVAPHEAHQFRADLGVALGFLCIVDRERDRPQPVETCATEPAP